MWDSGCLEFKVHKVRLQGPSGFSLQRLKHREHAGGNMQSLLEETPRRCSLTGLRVRQDTSHCGSWSLASSYDALAYLLGVHSQMFDVDVEVQQGAGGPVEALLQAF